MMTNIPNGGVNNDESSSGGPEYPGGGVLPPTPEDYRRMWEEQSKQMKPAEYERRSRENERKARQKVFQEAVAQATAAEPRLVSSFHQHINVVEPPKRTKRPSNRRG